MSTHYCRKCEKRVDESEAILYREHWFCPVCKNQLSYFGQEAVALSKGASGPVSVEEAKAAYVGVSKSFIAPKTDLTVLDSENALRLNPENVNALMHLGLYYMAQTSFDKSVTYFQRIVEIDPENRKAYQHLADIALQEKRYDNAVFAIDALHRLTPDDPMILYNLGLAHYYAGNLTTAIQCLQSSHEKTTSSKTKLELEKILSKLMFELDNSKKPPTPD